MFDIERKKKIAQRIKKLRKSKKLSHQKLAEELRKKYNITISKDSLIQYEVDTEHHSKWDKLKGMNIEYLYYLADFFNVSVDYILGITDNPTTDKTLDFICNYTGLSQSAVNTLRQLNTTKCKTISQIIESNEFLNIVHIIISAQYNKDLLLPNGAPIVNRISNILSEKKRSADEIISERFAEQVAQRGLAPFYKQEVIEDITTIFNRLTESGEK